ncbi:MAG: FAD-dependent oxidoreductase, partial [Pseudomonadota bacterium]
EQGFDHVIVSTGIKPRTPDIPGIDHTKVAGYIDVITGKKPVGKKVAIIGAGGIGFDVSELISHSGPSGALDRDVFAKEWGVDFENHPRGGVTGVEPEVAKSDREITLLQRKDSRVGSGLKTTGWTHRLALTRRGVGMMNGITYEKIDDDGLHVLQSDGQPLLIEADTVIICAGQDPLRDLYDDLESAGLSADLIGGAYEAKELDAKAAINQASRMAAEI